MTQASHTSTKVPYASPNAHRRRASSLLESGQGTGEGLPRRRSPLRAHGWKYQGKAEQYKDRMDPADEDRRSRVSSQSTSEDVELDNLPTEDEITDDEETGLTNMNKRKRKQTKRRIPSMDSRVLETANVTEEEKKLADLSVFKRLSINAILIASWYLFSLSISVYNKWMFDPGHLDFPFPLFTTCMHMLVQFSLASLVLYLFPRFRPRSDSISNPNNIPQATSDERVLDKGKPLMTRSFYLTRIGPCGAATGLDIGLGNMSLKFITLTFFTMCKSSALGFVLLFAFIFHLETPSIKLILIILTMTIGVILMVAGEVGFNTLGFVLIISSAFFSGFRWALTQILLLRNPATSNPFSSIFFLAPIMFLTLAILAIPIEGFGPLVKGFESLASEYGVFRGLGILLFPGVLAFCMTSSEFALLQRSSVVTLSICGIFKEVVTISAAGFFFHDPLTPINLSGLAVTIGSIAAYNYVKITKMRDDARKDIKAADDAAGSYEPTPTEDEETNDLNGFSNMPSGPNGAIRPIIEINESLVDNRTGSEASVKFSPVKRPEDLE